MQVAQNIDAKSLEFAGTDLEIRAKIGGKALTIDIMKAGSCVHRVTVDDALERLEHGWIADLFAGEHRVDLAALSHDADDYIEGLDVNQG